MFQTLEVFDSLFSNTHMTIPLQDISVRQRHYIKLRCTITGLDFQSLSKTTAIVYHLFPCQTCAPQTLWTSQPASNSGKALEFHLHGFHREAPSIIQLYLDPSHC